MEKWLKLYPKLNWENQLNFNPSPSTFELNHKNQKNGHVLPTLIWFHLIWNWNGVQRSRKKIPKFKPNPFISNFGNVFFCLFCRNSIAPDPPSNLSVSVRSGKSAVISLSPPSKGNYSSFKLRVSARIQKNSITTHLIGLRQKFPSNSVCSSVHNTSKKKNLTQLLSSQIELTAISSMHIQL